MKLKLFLVIPTLLAVAYLATAAVAVAGNPSLCARDGWTTAQSSSGQSFTSLKDCATARDVYQPTLSINPTAVGANQRFTVTALGFHSSAQATLYVAVTGSPPYFNLSGATDASGNVVVTTQFTGCGAQFPYDITLTFVDSSGVHASARLTLC
jgi:hypothetical protein